MRQLICTWRANYYLLLERFELFLLRRILRSEINAGDIVQAYGGCGALLEDLCESEYEDEIIDFALGSSTGHYRISEAAYNESQRKLWGDPC